MRPSPPGRLYGLLLRLLPPDIRAYRLEMVAAFEELWRDAGGGRGRAALLARTLGRLPAVLAMEWLEHLGAIAAPGRTTTTRTGGREMLRDLGYALRSLRKAPAFAASAVGLIALGVGAVTLIFSLVDHVLLRPLPYPDEERLVHLGNPSHSGPFFQALEGVDGVEAWAGATTARANVELAERPELMIQASVSDGFFGFFGARAARGRLLGPGDAGTDAVVVSHGAWRSHWGGAPGLVGRTVRVNGRPRTVVGVLAPDFQAPEALVGAGSGGAAGAGPELWGPLDWTQESLTETSYSVLQIAGRTRTGVTAGVVQQEVDALLTALAAEDEHYLDREGRVAEVPVRGLAEATVQGVRQGLGLLLAAVGVLLLVACANVAHLFLARGLGRSREMAVRRAVGAGAGTVARHLFAESLLVGLAGALLGAGLAAGGLQLFLALNPAQLPRAATVTLDPRVLAFAGGVSALTALVFGMLPAMRSVQTDLAAALHAGGRSATGGRGARGLRHALVAGEVALSLVLLASAGLLVRSFVGVRAQETGFRVEGVWTVPLSPAVETPEEYRALAEELVRSVGDVPGVESAALGLTMPLQFTGGGRCCWGSRVVVDGTAFEDLRVSMHPVTEGYFATLELELLAGRGWTEAEGDADPVPVVLSEPLAREAFGSAEAAVGRTLEVGGGGTVAVVRGVVADNHHYGLEVAHGAALYLPLDQLGFAIPMAHLAVRASPGATAGLGGALREAVWAVAPELPVPTVRPMSEWLGRSTAERRFQSAVFAAFAAVGLLLAAGGLYGTLLFLAAQRRREMGIRLALGASRGRIERRLLVSGLGMTGAGVLLGLAGAWATGRFLEAQVWGVEPGDPVTLAGAAGLLMATAALASWLPARRAGRTDPLETLRVE